jgi:hypothetical protein
VSGEHDGRGREAAVIAAEDGQRGLACGRERRDETVAGFQWRTGGEGVDGGSGFRERLDADEDRWRLGVRPGEREIERRGFKPARGDVRRRREVPGALRRSTSRALAKSTTPSLLRSWNTTPGLKKSASDVRDCGAG